MPLQNFSMNYLVSRFGELIVNSIVIFGNSDTIAMV